MQSLRQMWKSQCSEVKMSFSSLVHLSACGTQTTKYIKNLKNSLNPPLPPSQSDVIYVYKEKLNIKTTKNCKTILLSYSFKVYNVVISNKLFI